MCNLSLSTCSIKLPNVAPPENDPEIVNIENANKIAHIFNSYPPAFNTLIEFMESQIGM